MNAAGVDDDSVFEIGFDPVPLAELPSSRLQDIMKSLEDKNPTVLTLDSLIFNDSTAGKPKAQAEGLRVLQTFLYHLKPSVKTLSLRFNNLTTEAQDYFIEWITQNDWIEIVYLQGTGFDSKKKEALKAGWKQNLSSHRTDNFDQTLIRFVRRPPCCTSCFYIEPRLCIRIENCLICPFFLIFHCTEYTSILMPQSWRRIDTDTIWH